MTVRHMSIARRPGSKRLPGKPDLTLLKDVVADKILDAMTESEKLYRKLGIRHCVIGGLAVGAYGAPRATKDVDFLVGGEAFEKQAGGFVTFVAGLPIEYKNVAVDPVSISDDEEFLEEALDLSEVSQGIPFAPLGALLYLKLKSPRKRDEADIVRLLQTNHTEIPGISEYVRSVASEALVKKFESLVTQAREEEE